MHSINSTEFEKRLAEMLLKNKEPRHAYYPQRLAVLRILAASEGTRPLTKFTRKSKPNSPHEPGHGVQDHFPSQGTERGS